MAVGPIFKTKKYLIGSSPHFLPKLAASDHCGFILAGKDKEEEAIECKLEKNIFQTNLIELRNQTVEKNVELLRRSNKFLFEAAAAWGRI